jgi:hypothetical protein
VNPLDDSIIAWLSEHYGGFTATRALWQWAGGEVSEIAFGETADPAWRDLWPRARAGAPATPVALLREALFDRPGDGQLLEFLTSLAMEMAAHARPGARRLAALLEEWRVILEVEGLREASGDVPLDNRDVSFALMAPVLQGRLGPEKRASLSRRFAAIRVDPGAEAVRGLAAGLEDALEGTRGFGPRL